MLVKHFCGHEVNVPPRNAWFVRRSICYECAQIRKRLFDEQLQGFAVQQIKCKMKDDPT